MAGTSPPLLSELFDSSTEHSSYSPPGGDGLPAQRLQRLPQDRGHGAPVQQKLNQGHASEHEQAERRAKAAASARIDRASRTISAQYDIVDYYSSLGMARAGRGVRRAGLAAADQMPDATPRSRKVACCGRRMRRPKRSILLAVFLLLLGIVASLAGFAVNAAIFGLLSARDKVYRLPGEDLWEYLVWILLPIPAAMAAAWSVAWLAPAASGSGIPEMKSLLSGIIHIDLLAPRTLLAKFVGVIAGHAAGLSVGREGPFVHLAAGMAAALMKMRPFGSALHSDAGMRLQLYSAAIAVGVTATFGAPIGGVLFSVEVTSDYYRVSLLPWAFISSVTGVFFVWSLGNIPVLDVYPNLNLFSTEAKPIPYSWIEFVGFTLIGIVAGVIGALFVYVAGKLVRLRATTPALAAHPYRLVVGVALLTAVISYPINQYFVGTEQVTINQLVSPASDHASSDNKLASSLLDLAVFVPVKFFSRFGTFTPVFAMGAALGRLVGEIMAQAWPRLDLHPAGYAIVGAGALTCGVTRSISTAIIAIELTGQTHHLVPVFLAVTLAYTVGNLFTVSIYDVMHTMKGIPCMPSQVDEDAYAVRASTIMRTDLIYLTVDASYLDVLNSLYDNDYTSYPLVDSASNKTFLGTVTRTSLELELEARIMAYVARRESWIEVNSPQVNATSPLLLSVASITTTEPVSPLRAALLAKLQVWSRTGPPALSSPAMSSYLARLIPHLSPELFRYLEGLTLAGDLADVLAVDEAPFQIVPQTPLERVDFLFKMAVISHMWVVTRGELVGVVTKKDVMEFEMQYE
ncbi:chloride channel protein 2 [Thecamonas trahens ATCC 50062]|uniref:Chloride channel protein n=1 Tax=Thecamonas trahens ATCC 50062 TaxID=461836 RepID=A0A0L0DF32_THETB|nr:chloride channel protein 2 [Thecamonas trahens ATCC 50062]KNC50952.1 chloride channel protein 2 [Thecamonas trahens ATCC 50062]|eukprot:XP_013756648.1 chloride channel protein 2 [Thecamonas trahens ATCC 50062]